MSDGSIADRQPDHPVGQRNDHRRAGVGWIYALADPDAIQHGTLVDHGDRVRYLSEQT
jgi:hypothetical protein